MNTLQLGLIQGNLRCFGANCNMSWNTRFWCYFVLLKYSSVLYFTLFPSLKLPQFRRNISTFSLGASPLYFGRNLGISFFSSSSIIKKTSWTQKRETNYSGLSPIYYGRNLGSVLFFIFFNVKKNILNSKENVYFFFKLKPNIFWEEPVDQFRPQFCGHHVAAGRGGR